MANNSQNQRYPNVIPAGTTANAISIPIFAADFTKLQFSLLTNSAADYNVTVVKSNQENPPNPALAISATNMYSDCMFSDESTQVNYDVLSPFNPTSVALDKNFSLQTQGARWFFIVVSGYTAGAVLKLDAFLFSNET